MNFNRITSFLYLLLASPFLQAAECSNVIQQIDTDRKTYSNANQPAPWKTLTWFETALGKASEKKEMTTSFYQWNDYQLFIIGQGSRLLDAATRTLGKPSTTLSGHLTQYGWTCNNRSSISLTTDQNSDLINTISYTIIKKDGDSSIAHFSPGNIDMQAGKFNDELIKAAWTDATLKNAIQAYNAHFKTKIQNKEEFEKAITEQFKNFYDSLKKCRSGIYRYTLISPVSMAAIFPVSTIHDMKNNLCSLTTNFNAPGGKVEMNCPFGTFKKLPDLTDQQLTSAATGNFFLFPNPMQVQSLFIFTSCRTLLNGKNLMIYEDSAIPL